MNPKFIGGTVAELRFTLIAVITIGILLGLLAGSLKYLNPTFAIPIAKAFTIIISVVLICLFTKLMQVKKQITIIVLAYFVIPAVWFAILIGNDYHLFFLVLVAMFMCLALVVSAIPTPLKTPKF